MRFNLSIDCDNAVFEDEPATEIARIMATVAERVTEGGIGGNVRDLNGNTVGGWTVTA